MVDYKVTINPRQLELAVAMTLTGTSGLAPGDVITQVSGCQYTQAARWWAATNPKPVTLNVQRGHRELSFTVHPAARQHVTSLV